MSLYNKIIDQQKLREAWKLVYKKNLPCMRRKKYITRFFK